MFCLFSGSSVTFDVRKFVKFWRSRIYFGYFVKFVWVFVKKKKNHNCFLRFFRGGVPLGIVHMEQDRT